MMKTQNSESTYQETKGILFLRREVFPISSKGGKTTEIEVATGHFKGSQFNVTEISGNCLYCDPESQRAPKKYCH